MPTPIIIRQLPTLTSFLEVVIMVRNTSFLAMLGAAILVVLTNATANAADPSGTWTWTVTTQAGQEFELSLELKLDNDKLTGALTLPMGDSIEIKDGTFKDDVVAFKVEFERDGNVRTTKYQGKVDGDTLKGKTERERDGEVQSRDWEAKRDKK
jgi:hypothetical protein